MTDDASTPVAPKPSQGAPEQATDDPKDKKCHYVPKFLLKKFVQENGQLLELSKKTGRTWRKPPKNVCQVTNLYKTRILDMNLEPLGPKTFQAEDSLSVIEKKAAPIILEIIRQLEHGDGLDICNEQREHLYPFLATLPLRSIPYHVVASERAGEWDVHNAYKALLDDREDQVDIIEAVIDATKDYMAKALVAMASREDLLRLRLRILRISCPDVFLATSGIPFVYLIENRGYGAWVSLDPKTAISLANLKRDHLFCPSRDRVQAMNRYMFDLCGWIYVQTPAHAEEIKETRETQVDLFGRTTLRVSIKK